MFLKVQDHHSLVRDTESGAVINTDRTEYDNYLKRVEAQKSLNKQVEENAESIKELKSDMTEIKQLLIALINKDK
jgi:hypothetical protein